MLNENTVKRIDCICAIMRSIGTNDKQAEICVFYTDYYYPVFNDIQNEIKTGYIIIANSADIAFGVKDKQFEPDRDTTVKECLAFI